MKPKKASVPKASQPAATLLTMHKPEDLQEEMQGVQLVVARRAYELFEMRGREHGHDWEDWFRAESELLRPVSASISESKERISVRVNVLGFEKNELRVSVEPCQITILGKKEVSATETEGGKIEYIDRYPDQIAKVIDLGTEVKPESSVVKVQAGVLQFELRTAPKRKAKTAPAA
jgi:HSP20 family protein